MQATLPFVQHAEAALDWVRCSIAATGGKGSAHSYSPIFGWAKAYPETTGYLIETLFDYGEIRLAFDCARWLCSLQLPTGAFPGLLVGHTRPSVFNTAQILFGLARALDECRKLPENAADRVGERDLQIALENALAWLLRIQEPDGAWRTAAYVPGFTPTYYTRAVWGVLRAAQTLEQQAESDARVYLPLPGLRLNMHRALDFYATRFLPNGAISDWGFRPGEPAFTHTIAYALEGFFECARLLERPDVMQKTCQTADQLLVLRRSKGKTAGAYDTRWAGNFSFICLPGHAQLAALFFRMGKALGRVDYLDAAAVFLSETLVCQKLAGNAGSRGALPGSAPFWGKYQRFRYPNWGVKFLLDAIKQRV